MNYLAFTHMRTKFLRYFYADASSPFRETQRKIEAYEEPFEAPPGYEDSEPPFLAEFQDAGDALDVVGQSVASFLSQTLRLYIEHWVLELKQRAGEAQLKEVGVGLPNEQKYKSAFDRGWFNGYRAYCAALDIDWAHSSVDLSVLEQLVLARNAVQHLEDVTSNRVRQSESDAERFPEGFFADEFDLRLNESTAPGSRFLLPPRLDMSGEKLARVFSEVDSFCSWLDEQHPMRAAGRAR